MDHLVRTPLLEYSLPGKQRLKPGGAPKDRTRRLGKTDASMPTRRGEHARWDRRAADHRRLNQARDRHKGLSRRRAQRDYRERRPKAHHGHTDKKRENPNAPHRPEKRGNPHAKTKTQVRESPSKLERRPTLPATPQFVTRGMLMKGRRV